jgi:hypothetical protein
VLVFVSTEISGGRVRFTADAYEAAQGFWDRVRSHAPRSLAHAFAERRVDGEIGSFLPAVPLVSSHVDKAVGPSEVVALACGDVDADGSLELVAVGRRRIEIGRIRAGRFMSLGETTWPALSPVAPSPLREPIASVVVAPGEHVDVGITDRQIGVRLSPTLAALGVLDQPLPWLGVGCLIRAGLALGAPRPCTSGEPAALTVGALADIDAVSGTRVVTGDGQSHAVVAWRERATGAAVVADDTGRSVRVPGAGAQIAVGDLDFDGVPEIVSGADTRTAPSDVLTVRSWSKEGDLRERYRLPVPEGIKAVAVCPAEDARAAAIVVATGGSLWVVR